MNPLEQLHEHGQSFWYDNMRRQYLEDDTIQNMIDNDGLRGITSNPAIFQKAIGESDDYDSHIKELITKDLSTHQIYETLALADIQAACDKFTRLYEESDGGDGYVSLEVSPHLAHDTAGTIAEARRLYDAVSRPNVMIKVPATEAGIPAIEQLIGEGINVNVTLMFNMDHYEKVAYAYIQGLRTLSQNGGDVNRVASVASFFVSRVDSAVDDQIDQHDDPAAAKLRGKVAIANAKVVYQRFKDIFLGPDFQQIGGRVQRVLWASTSTKDPNYPDTLYPDNLIGPHTVNTMPPATVDAFRDHGTVADTLEEDVDEARRVLQKLKGLGIDLDEITQQLQDEGVEKFSRPFDKLMDAIEQKADELS